MLIVSHNLVNHDFPIPKDAIFRINLAWISNLEILKEILEKCAKNNPLGMTDLRKNFTHIFGKLYVRHFMNHI